MTFMSLFVGNCCSRVTVHKWVTVTAFFHDNPITKTIDSSGCQKSRQRFYKHMATVSHRQERASDDLCESNMTDDDDDGTTAKKKLLLRSIVT